MGQIAQELQRRPMGNLSSGTIPNPKMKEQCNAIYIRSGKVLGHDNDICKRETIAKEVVEPLPSEDEVLCETNMEKTLSGKNKQERGEASKWNYPKFKPQAPYPMKKKKNDLKLGAK